jgi:hypothetical protein
MCMYIHVYMYIHINKYAYLYMCMYVYIRKYIHIYIQTYMYTFSCYRSVVVPAYQEFFVFSCYFHHWNHWIEHYPPSWRAPRLSSKSVDYRMFLTSHSHPLKYWIILVLCVYSLLVRLPCICFNVYLHMYS